MSVPQNTEPTKTDDSGYEKRDVNLNKIIAFGVIGLVVVIALLVIMVDYFTAVKEEIIYEQVLTPQSAALRELRARETEELNSYKLLDSAKGIYRIPIERAMGLIADEAYKEQTGTVGKQ